MRTFELTCEQNNLAKIPSEAFVEACPGAGKTRTMVARLGQIAPNLPPRRGVSILSFTNSAVDEIKNCSASAGLDQVLRHPNFVGTFDAFVRHFLVLPFGIPEYDNRPIIVDSWRTLGVEVRLSGSKAFRGSGVSLDYFDPRTNHINLAQIRHRGLQKHVEQHQIDYELASGRRRASLRRNGYLSASDARLEAQRLIKGTECSDALGHALTSRFEEIIVDEAQDCNPLDLEILSWLRSHSIRVTTVCDPDQAIYGFRHGDLASLQNFKKAYNPKHRLTITGNFRCSGPICALAATLRKHSTPDQALGATSRVTLPIVVSGYHGTTVPAEIGCSFCEYLGTERINVHRDNGIILAHQMRDAQRAAGLGTHDDTQGTSKVEILARALRDFWSNTASGRTRNSAIRSVEKLLLQCSGVWEDDDLHPSRVVERSGLDRRMLRRHSLNLLMRLPRFCEDTKSQRENWVETARKKIENLGLTLPPRQTVRAFLRKPSSAKWTQHLQRQSVEDLACSTIHEAKGREYEAVCLVIRPDRAPENYTSALFDAWENRKDLEAKRVIYVGITRAKRFLMIAVPEKFTDRCQDILRRGLVPFEYVGLCNKSNT